LKKYILVASLLASTLLAKEKIVVFHAGSLAKPFKDIEKAFETKNPKYDVLREASGSVAAIKKVTILNRGADVVASADYKAIDKLMIGKDAKFNASFATNKMAIAIAPKAKFRDEISEKNWFDIVLKDGVKVGHSNPNLDPCGYRTMLVAQLTEKAYGKKDFFKELFGYGDHYEVGEENKKKVIVRPKETDLLALVESSSIDYLFIYESVAKQHGLKYITLEDSVNLGNAKLNSEYAKATFKIDGKKKGQSLTQVGESMVYGLTIPENKKSPLNRAGAIKFVKFILSDEGKAIIKKNGQSTISPARVTGDSTIIK